jgi:diaminopimelate epimerase
MGAPILEPDRIPVALPGPRVLDHPVEVLGETLRITCVSMGNPHAVVFVDDLERFDVARFGAALERHPLFPRRTNVEFAERVGAGSVRQRTFERGSGETLACGTGACAVAVAGRLTGRTGDRIRNRLRGGELVIEWDGRGPVFMTGDAIEVFTGEWRPHGV